MELKIGMVVRHEGVGAGEEPLVVVGIRADSVELGVLGTKGLEEDTVWLPNSGLVKPNSVLIRDPCPLIKSLSKALDDNHEEILTLKAHRHKLRSLLGQVIRSSNIEIKDATGEEGLFEQWDPGTVLHTRYGDVIVEEVVGEDNARNSCDVGCAFNGVDGCLAIEMKCSSSERDDGKGVWFRRFV